MSNPRNPEWVRQWDQAILMVAQVGVVRDMHGEINIVHNI